MEPLPKQSQELKIYRYAWLPLAGVLAYLLRTSGNVSWLEATAVAVPLCAVGQFELVAAKYTCKFAPLKSTTLWRLITTHLFAAQVIALIWVGIGKAIAYVIAQQTPLRGLDQQFASQAGVVYIAANFFYYLAAAYYYVLLAQAASHQAEARAMETSILAREAELKALKAQINPHFLFNSLNSISALTSIDPARAREMCLLLADFLRMTLRLGEKVQIPLSQELELLEKFLAIEKVRFGARLTMEMAVDEQAKECLVPTLLLQPLVENAVTHGIAKLTEGGTVRLSAANHGNQLTVIVENSMDPDAPADRKGGMGLRNVRERLEARYGKDASVRATAEEETFRVNLSMPAEYEGKA
jgi:two-component system sensor histidine kinase AlgZ